jgi:hypothetical protein
MQRSMGLTPCSRANVSKMYQIYVSHL